MPLPGMDAAIKEMIGDVTQKEALEPMRPLWREPVWDLKIVAGRILARKSIEPDDMSLSAPSVSPISTAGRSRTIWRAPASRCLVADPSRLDAVEAWIENRPLRESLA